MNLAPCPVTKASLNTQESPMADPHSVDRQIRDAVQELRVIKQEINMWTMQVVRGGKLDVITRDIEATLAERKDMFA